MRRDSTIILGHAKHVYICLGGDNIHNNWRNSTVMELYCVRKTQFLC